MANNIQGAGQTYQFVNFNTPYGSIYTAAIPIPGDVVTQMAASLLKVQQQLAPLIQLVAPVPAVFNIIITEGDPSSLVGTVTVQNNGAFGSFMSVVATPDSPFISCTPPTASAIAFGQTTQFTIQLNPAVLTGGQNYQAHVNFQDNRNSPVTIPVTVNVRVLPRPEIETTPDAITLTFALLTGTPSGGQSISVTNSGPSDSILNFSVSKVQNNSSWLSFSPVSGGPLASGESSSFVASVVSSAVPYQSGTFSEVLRVSSPNASNSFVDIPVTLIVS